MLSRQSRRSAGFTHPILFLFFILVVAVLGFAGWKVYKKNQPPSGTSKILNSGASAIDKAVTAGKTLSGNRCSGTGDTTFTHLPMNASDFSILVPYGVTVGGHVTPVDHQYFSPANFHSAKDTYPVYAMADSKITNIEVHPPENGSNGRIRMIFTVSCNFLYYYDLVTSVQPGIDDKHIPIDVKAGQLIGHIGGQTLDFAVWNTQKPLPGFVNPSSYDGEAWKVYTADPFPYYTPALRQIVEAKDPRVAEPIAGKIDYDIDGKLIGNWFIKGSGGYSGASQGHDPNYSNTHLSIAPDLYDPSAIVVSVGNYDSYPLHGPELDSSNRGGGGRQYFAKPGGVDPAKVSQSSGPVKYELVQRYWRTPSGALWDNMSLVKGPKADTTSSVVGTILLQLTGKRELKAEVFRGLTASQVSGFDATAKTYTR